MERKWSFVIATGLPPEVYDEMTTEDYNAAVKAHDKMNRKGGK